jgi:hypothetical protein
MSHLKTHFSADNKRILHFLSRSCARKKEEFGQSTLTRCGFIFDDFTFKQALLRRFFNFILNYKSLCTIDFNARIGNMPILLWGKT